MAPRTSLLLRISDHQIQTLIDRVLAKCRKELSDIRMLPTELVEQDLRPMIRWHTEFILESFNNRSHSDEEIFRNSSIRRFRQGVSVQSLDRSYEIWGEELWEAFLSHSLMDEPGNSLQVASLISSHLERARRDIRQIYLDESSGRQAGHKPLRSDLLDALISVDGSDDFVARLLLTLQIDVAVPHVLLLIRPRSRTTMAPKDLELVLLEARRLFNNATIPIVANGIRRDDIVIICALENRSVSDVIAIGAQIAKVSQKFAVGVSGSLVGAGAFVKGFTDALSAINYVPGRGERRVYTTREAVINRLLRRSQLGEELRRDAVYPIVDYDHDHQSELMLTLQTFVDTDFNSKVTSQRLHVQPNTIRYRLKRIADITGYDPFSAQGIFTLMAGLRSIGPTLPTLHD